MNQYTVSMIPYANMAPFRVLAAPLGISFVEQTPRQSAVALAEGTVQAACVPVGALPALGDCVRPIGPYGIAARGPVGSVFLFSKKPFEQMDARSTIYLTDHSATSVRLLYLLLGGEHGFENLPVRAPDLSGADGELIIGDRALVEVRGTDYPYVTDLAERWVDREDLPFVFARWVVRNDASESLTHSLLAWFEEFSWRKEGLVRLSVPVEARRLGLSDDEMAAYLKTIRWSLGDVERQAMDRFLDLWRQHGREPVFALGGAKSEGPK